MLLKILRIIFTQCQILFGFVILSALAVGGIHGIWNANKRAGGFWHYPLAAIIGGFMAILSFGQIPNDHGAMTSVRPLIISLALGIYVILGIANRYLNGAFFYNIND